MAGESSLTPLITSMTLSESCGFLGCVGRCGELSDSVECGEMVDLPILGIMGWRRQMSPKPLCEVWKC